MGLHEQTSLRNRAAKPQRTHLALLVPLLLPPRAFLFEVSNDGRGAMEFFGWFCPQASALQLPEGQSLSSAAVGAA